MKITDTHRLNFLVKNELVVHHTDNENEFFVSSATASDDYYLQEDFFDTEREAIDAAMDEFYD